MLKTLLIFLFIIMSLSNYVFLFTLPIFAQGVDTAWVRRYNGPGSYWKIDEAYGLAVDNFGNVYVTGASEGSGTLQDFLTIKYSPIGDTVWTRRYNGLGNNHDEAFAIALDSAGNIYVTGGSYGIGTDYDYATVKYDPQGNELWVKRYNGLGNWYDIANDIAVDDSGNVYVTGRSDGSGTYSDIATIKYDSNGNELWVRRYNYLPGGLNERGSGIVVDDSGNVYVTGSSEGTLTSSDYVTIKYYPNGDTAWVRRFNGPLPNNSHDYAQALTLDYSGNVYVTGQSVGSGTNYDFATVKYDSNGNELWVGRYNGPGNGSDEANSIAVDDSGNVYITGTSWGGGTWYDYATIKYHPNGDTAWVRRYNGPGNYGDEANALAVDGSGDVYVTGNSAQSVSYPINYDYATLKYYSNGDLAWVKRYNGPGDGYDVASDIAMDDSGNVYVTGRSPGIGTDYDYATIKYFQFPCGCGDTNGDSLVTVSDVVYLINYLFKGGSAPDPIYASDVNCDGKSTVSDVVYLINYLFKGGPEPSC